MTVETLVGLGILLGFSLAIPPGPMNALIAARSTVSWSSGFVTGLGAMTADALLGAIVFAFQSFVELSTVIRYIDAVGSVVMFVLAYVIARAPRGGVSAARPDLATYSQAVGLGLSNPFQILWWLTAGTALAYVGGIPLFGGLFGAIFTWVVAFPLVLHTGARRYPAIEPWVRYASATLMVAFAVYFALLAAVPGL